MAACALDSGHVESLCDALNPGASKLFKPCTQAHTPRSLRKEEARPGSAAVDPDLIAPEDGWEVGRDWLWLVGLQERSSYYPLGVIGHSLTYCHGI